MDKGSIPGLVKFATTNSDPFAQIDCLKHAQMNVKHSQINVRHEQMNVRHAQINVNKLQLTFRHSGSVIVLSFGIKFGCHCHLKNMQMVILECPSPSPPARTRSPGVAFLQVRGVYPPTPQLQRFAPEVSSQ